MVLEDSRWNLVRVGDFKTIMEAFKYVFRKLKMELSSSEQVKTLMGNFS